MTCTEFAFSSLNLKFNPFGELSDSEWVQSAIVDVDRFVNELEQPNVAIQLIGDHGRGKTTHLKIIHQYFFNQAYLKVFPGGPLPKLNSSDIFFIDSIDHLTLRERKVIYRKCRSIVFTTHQNLSRELEKEEFHIVTEHVSCRCEHKLLRILNRKIEVARLGSGEVPTIEMSLVKDLMARYDDNIRAMQNYLYEYFQDLEGMRSVKMSD